MATQDVYARTVSARRQRQSQPHTPLGFFLARSCRIGESEKREQHCLLRSSFTRLALLFEHISIDNVLEKFLTTGMIRLGFPFLEHVLFQRLEAVLA